MLKSGDELREGHTEVMGSRMSVAVKESDVKNEDDPGLVLSMRPSNASIAVMWMFAGVGFCILALAATKEASFWRPAAVCLVVGLLGTVWFRSFRLDIHKDSLHYFAPLRPVRILFWQDIGAARMELGMSRYSDVGRPLLRLAIIPKDAATCYVTIKMFKRADIDKLLRILRERHLFPEKEADTKLGDKAPSKSTR